MADQIDNAHEVEERLLSLRIASAAVQRSGLTPRGSCHYCGELLTSAEQLYCDHECASEHDYELKRRRVNG